MAVADALKNIRKKRKLSQVQLEARSGVSQSQISSIERGEKNPTVETLELLAKGLHVDVVDLLGQEKSPPKKLSGLDLELVNLLVDLPDSELQRVKDFVAGLKASRKA